MKCCAASAIAVADVERRNELGVRVNCQPSPAIPGALWRGLGRLDVLRLGIDESPNLIDLEALATQVAQRPVLVVAECLAGIFQQLNNRVLAGAGCAADGPDRHALDHQAKDLSASGAGEFVHCRIMTYILDGVKHKSRFHVR